MKSRQFLALVLMAVLLVAVLPAAAGPTGPIQMESLGPTAVWTAPQDDGTWAVAWGDWDNDGDLDLAVANRHEPNRIYENEGGALTLAWSSPEDQLSTCLAWGDYDNDGDLDLAFGSDMGVNQLYENEGGALTLVWTGPEDSGTTSVAWGDWDNDGDLDLAVGNWESANQVYENEGGTLTLAWTAPSSSRTRSVAWGDWDNDGDLDLAVGNEDIDPSWVYENDGGSLTLAWSSPEADSTTSVAWGDYDGDGDLDLAFGNEGQVNWVFENDGGTLSPAWSAPEIESTQAIAWGDWDGDGDLDLAIANAHNGASAQVYRNDGGIFSLAWTSAEDDAFGCSVAWGDWNGDGDLDLAVGNSEGPNLVYENLSGPISPVATWHSTEEDTTYDVAWGDWDGDGDLDLAVANHGGPNRIYENDGGQLTLAQSLVEEANSRSVAWGDWDGDGDLDLAVGNYGQSNWVYENDGGNLTLAWSSADEDATNSLAWGDWDGDGDLDLAVGNYNQPTRVYENNGTSLTLGWSSEEEDATMDLAWGDYDNDGDLDLAVGNYNQPTRVYRNYGTSFNLAWSSGEEDATQGVAWGDYDGDGDLDLAVGNHDQPNRIYRNDGGAFALAWSSDEVANTKSVAWIDWDGDSDLDLFAGNDGQPSRVYENLGTGLEQVAVWATMENNVTYSGAWGDYDGDGDMDLATGNLSQPLCLYVNNRVAPFSLPNNPAYPVVYRPGNSDDAYFFSSAEILTGASVPVWFRLFDAEGDRVPRIVARYSTDGGGQWQTATITGTVTNLSASPTGALHSISWNALADSVSGDNVRFRIISVNDDPTLAGAPIQHPYMAADTPSFRLRPLALTLLPFRQLGFGPGGTVVTHTLTLVNRTGQDGLFAVGYDSLRGWPVDGPNLVGPVPDQGLASFVVSATVPAGPAGVLDVVTATTAALFNPTAFQTRAYLFTYRGATDVDLSITKDAPATVQAGSLLTYTLVARNAGSSPASGVVVADMLPPEATFSWAGQEGVYSPTLGAVLWPDHLLFAGQALTFTVAVTAGCVPAGTVITNDNYAVAATQHITPVHGAAVNTTVLDEAPQAAFAVATDLSVGVPFTLTNNSTNATAFLWDFGDGITSTLAEPMHTYAAEGSYTIALTAYGSCDSDQAQATVTATLYLVAGFVANDPICLGNIVVFTNTTAGIAPISYLWGFADGITSTLEHPTHTYAAAGAYMVTLQATNDYATDLAGEVIDVLSTPGSAFTYTVVSLTVTLTNTSENADGYLWSFGDGAASTAEHPTHTYAAAGTYVVTLAASGPCGTDESSTPIAVGGGTTVYRVFLPHVDKGYPPAVETELAYDDGTLDSTASWEIGRGYATCFTPPGASARLLRARYYLQDPQPIEVHVWSADAHADLLTPFQADLAAEGWNEVDLSGYNLAVSGGFCVGFLHLQDYRPTLGVDTSAPDGQSYEVDGGCWEAQGYDAMIRVVVGEEGR